MRCSLRVATKRLSRYAPLNSLLQSVVFLVIADTDRCISDPRRDACSVHYFRIHPLYWRDRLLRVKAMGLNAIQVPHDALAAVVILAAPTGPAEFPGC